MIKAVGNTELCELLDVEPKAQCKVCLSYWDVGIVYCTFGHFLRDDTTENKKYIKSFLDLLLSSQEYHIANQFQKKCKKRQFLSIHDRFIRDVTISKDHDRIGSYSRNMSRDGQIGERGHHVTEEELNVYRSNWWIRSIFVGSDTMPIRHRVDFTEVLSTLRRFKNQEDQVFSQNWQILPHFGGIGKILGGILLLRHHRDDGPSTD